MLRALALTLLMLLACGCGRDAPAHRGAGPAVAYAAAPERGVSPDGRTLTFTAGAISDEVWVLENFLPELEP